MSINSLIIDKITTAKNINRCWDQMISSPYQKLDLLIHLEKYNYCNQRYYIGREHDNYRVGAVIYSLKINILTYAKYTLNIPMTVIGIPASVDAGGLVGDKSLYVTIISHILKHEKRVILCLNYSEPLEISKVVEMQTLPTLILNNIYSTFSHYLSDLRHKYRRRIKCANKKGFGLRETESSCSSFTSNHYELYLNILNRAKTKLEVLTQDFFVNLPETFKLYSIYIENELLTWHITTMQNGVYYFLFGGINYDLRDKYDSYYNNLISIIKKGIENKCHTINFGQTAEVSKVRLGAKLNPKKMFLHHSNGLINNILRMIKPVIEYKARTVNGVVLKNSTT
jgi:hypothetical protein